MKIRSEDLTPSMAVTIERAITRELRSQGVVFSFVRFESGFWAVYTAPPYEWEFQGIRCSVVRYYAANFCWINSFDWRHPQTGDIALHRRIV